MDPEQEARLRKLAAGASRLRISAAVGKSVAAVQSRAKNLGIQIITNRAIKAKLRDAEREAQN